MDIPQFSSLQGAVIDIELGGREETLNVGHAAGHGFVRMQRF